jgi:hypothetical protein
VDERHRLAVARVHRGERALGQRAAKREPGLETAWRQAQPPEALELQEFLERQAARVRALPVAAPQRAARKLGSEMALEPQRPRVELERQLLAQ